jgi:IPT/TIG domain
VQYPLPAIASLSPSTVVLGGPAFTLTVNGSNFVTGATVYWNHVSRVTQFVSSSQLTAAILASDLALPSANSASITVQNPAPSAGVSNAENLVLQNPAPIISAVSPTSGLAGLSIPITVSGSGFVAGATVEVGGQTFPTNTVTASSLNAQITASVGSQTLTQTPLERGP